MRKSNAKVWWAIGIIAVIIVIAIVVSITNSNATGNASASPTRLSTFNFKSGGTYVYLDDFQFGGKLAPTKSDLNLIYDSSGNFVGAGKDSTHLLRTNDKSFGVQIDFNPDTDDYFVASWNGTNKEGEFIGTPESYLMRATNFVLDNSIAVANIEYYKSGAWTTVKERVKKGDKVYLGNVELDVWSVVKSSTERKITLANTLTGTQFSKLFDLKGNYLILPSTKIFTPAPSYSLVIYAYEKDTRNIKTIATYTASHPITITAN